MKSKNNSLILGTDYEDVESITRISSADMHLDTYFTPYFNEVLQNFYMAQGYIYSHADLKSAIEKKSPHYQSNLFNPIILQVAGNFKKNMPGIEIMGVTEDDHRNSKLISDVNHNVLYQANDIVYELAKAYIYAAIGRISWLKQDFSFENDPAGNIKIEHYGNFLKFDTTSSRRDQSDCQFIDDSAYFSPEQLIGIYANGRPDLAEEIEAKAKILLGESAKRKSDIATWSERVTRRAQEYDGEIKGYDGNSLTAGDNTISRASGNSQPANVSGEWVTTDGRLKTVDWYERRQERTMVIYDRSNGKIYDVTEIVKRQDLRNKFVGLTQKNWFDNDALQIIRRHIAQPYISEESKMKIYQTSVVPGLNIQLYDAPQQLQNGNFKFTQISYYDFHPNILETKSLIDHIKDPVRSYTLRDNTNLAYLMRVAHGGYIVEEGVKKKGLGQLEQNKVGGITIVPNGTISQRKIMKKEVPPINNAIKDFIYQKREEVNEISGVSLNSRGTKETNSESGRLFENRVAQSDIMQEWVSENAQSALKRLVVNNIYFIQNLMTEERVIRIVANGSQPEWVEINKKVLGEVMNDVSIGKFDVEISIAPVGEAARTKERQKLIDLWSMVEKLATMSDDPKYLKVAERIFMEVLATTNISAQADIADIFKNSDDDRRKAMMEQMQMLQEKQQLEKAKAQMDLKEQGIDIQNKQTDGEGKKLDNLIKLDELRRNDFRDEFDEAETMLSSILDELNANMNGQPMITRSGNNNKKRVSQQ